MISSVICLALCALNFVMYVQSGAAILLFATIFCGGGALLTVAIWLKSR